MPKSVTEEKVKCKSCGKDVTKLLSHLLRTTSCQESYDMNAMKEEAKTLTKVRKAQRSRERYQNIPLHASQKRDAARKLYKENPERKKEAMRTYNSEHRTDINASMSHHYFDNRKKSQGNYECPVCNKEFILLKYVQRHIKEYHTEHNHTYICQICEKSIQYKSNLERHIREVHGGKKYKCEKCPAAYNRLDDLDQHTHSGWHYFEYNCDLCDETMVFKSVRSLVEHVIVKQPETEEKGKTQTFKMKRTGIFVTCTSYKRGFTVDGEKGSLSSNSRKCDKVWAEEKRMKHKEKIINEGLSRANTMAKVILKLTKQPHEEVNGTCVWCRVSKPVDEFCQFRHSSRGWTLERSTK